jgi:hypothetical protein
VCGAALPDPYGKLSKRKSSENIDAALQHSYISAQPRLAFSMGGGVAGKQPR